MESIIQFLRDAKNRGQDPLQALRDRKTNIQIYRNPAYDDLVGLKCLGKELGKIDRECNGIVIDVRRIIPIAVPFNVWRNDNDNGDALFNWCNFSYTDKEDGFLAILYYYDDHWQVNTDDSFGYGKVPNFSGNWRDLFWKHAPESLIDGLRTYDRNAHTTFLFEVCAPEIRTVRKHAEPKITLVGINNFDSRRMLTDYGVYDVMSMANRFGVNAIKFTEFYARGVSRARINAMAEINAYLASKTENDPTFEGVVLRDDHNRRLVIQTETFKTLRRLKGIKSMKPENIVPLCMKGENEQFFSALPDCVSAFKTVSGKLTEAFKDLSETWMSHRELETNKDFAEQVKEHPFGWLLFKMRKINPGGSPEDLRQLWRDKCHHQKISEKLFGDQVLEYTEI